MSEGRVRQSGERLEELSQLNVSFDGRLGNRTTAVKEKEDHLPDLYHGIEQWSHSIVNSFRKGAE